MYHVSAQGVDERMINVIITSGALTETMGPFSEALWLKLNTER